MSGNTPMSEEERDLLAAEHAMGLLGGGELAEAERLAAADADFRERVARWSGRLAPLLDDVAPAAPSAGLWAAIAQRIAPAADAPAGAGDPPPGETPAREAPAPVADAPASNVVQLRRKIGLWRGYSLAATALAASLALVLVTRPNANAPSPIVAPAPTAPPAPATPFAAVMEADGSATKLAASYDPASGNLVVTPVAGLSKAAGHSHQLWMIPPSAGGGGAGRPVPMGIIVPGAPNRMAVPMALRAAMLTGTTLALSVEPAGGSPTGAPTGPVIAAGKLVQA
jgi:anti-sigma-K factor RskA